MNNTYLNKFTKDIKEKPKDYDRNLIGIGGLFVIFIIYCILIVIFSLTDIPNQLSYIKVPFMKVYSWLMIAVYIPFETAFNVAFIVLIFKKNLLFRKLFVLYSVVVVLSMAAAFIYLLLNGEVFVPAIFRFVMTALWTAYLYTSKRVKNTFIYPYTDYAKGEKKKLIEF